MGDQVIITEDDKPKADTIIVVPKDEPKIKAEKETVVTEKTTVVERREV